MSVGTIVVNGIVFQIARLELRGGKTHFICEPLPGPLDSCPDAMLTIFGADGIGILQSGPFNFVGAGAGDVCELRYDSTVNTSYIKKVTFRYV